MNRAMSDLRETISRATDHIHASPSALNETLSRARRRARGRRVLAGTLALVVSAGAIFVLSEAFSGVSTRPAGTDSGRRTTAPKALNPVITDTFVVSPPPGSVSSAAYGFESLWVTGLDEMGDSTLWRIDPTSGHVVARMAVSATGWNVGGGGLSISDDSVWVVGQAGTDGVLLQRVDPAVDQVVQTIQLDGERGDDVAATDSGLWVLLSTGHPTTSVIRVDPALGEVVASIPLDIPFARRLVPAGSGIWVVGNAVEGGTVGEAISQRIDVATNQVSVTVSDPRSSGPYVIDNEMWAVRATGGEVDSLIRLDPETGNPIGDPVLVADGIHAPGLVGDPDGGIWLTTYDPAVDGSPSFLERFDPTSETVDASVQVGPNPVQIVVSPGNVWVLNYEGTITRVAMWAEA